MRIVKWELTLWETFLKKKLIPKSGVHFLIFYLKWEPKPFVSYFVKIGSDGYQKIWYPPNIGYDPTIPPTTTTIFWQQTYQCTTRLRRRYGECFNCVFTRFIFQVENILRIPTLKVPPGLRKLDALQLNAEPKRWAERLIARSQLN